MNNCPFKFYRGEYIWGVGPKCLIRFCDALNLRTYIGDSYKCYLTINKNRHIIYKITGGKYVFGFNIEEKGRYYAGPYSN